MEKEIVKLMKAEEEMVKVLIIITNLLENERELLIRVDAIEAKSKYIYKGRAFVSEEDYDSLYSSILKHQRKSLEIADKITNIKGE